MFSTVLHIGRPVPDFVAGGRVVLTITRAYVCTPRSKVYCPKPMLLLERSKVPEFCLVGETRTTGNRPSAVLETGTMAVGLRDR